jgi:NAD(P)H-flavin reductase/hemoglobin-like flavoprotein
MVERRDLSAPHVTHGNHGGRSSGEAAPLTWWRTRSWRKDLAVLARIRHGLKSLDDDQDSPAESEARPLAAPTAFVEAPPASPLAPLAPPAPAAPPPPSTTRPPSLHHSARASAVTPWSLRGPVPGVPTFTPTPQRGPFEPAAEAIPAVPPAWSETSAAVGDAAVGDAAFASMRESFGVVTRAGDKAVGYFYGSLFARNPRLRAMFPPAMDDQRDRLLAALVRIVESLSTPEELANYLGQLGRDHRKFGVEPAMYDAVGEALMSTMRAFAGETFTPAAQDMWLQAYTAASGIMIGAAEEASTREPAYWTAEVVENEQRHHGIAVVTVAPDQLLNYEAGQHVTVQTPRWPKVWRSYSVACRPREDGLMIFHVRAVSGGWVSNALVRYSPPGTDLILGPALGTMVLGHAGNRDLLLVAGGTGLSPLKAIIEQAVKESAVCPRQIYLFCGARRREELYDLPDLWRLADAYSGLQIIPVTSEDPAFAGMQGNVGRVAARYLPHRDCEAYVSGPPEMVAETIRVLKRAGIPPERIHYDDALLTDFDLPAGPPSPDPGPAIGPEPARPAIAASSDPPDEQGDEPGDERGDEPGMDESRQKVASSRQVVAPK